MTCGRQEDAASRCRARVSGARGPSLTPDGTGRPETERGQRFTNPGVQPVSSPPGSTPDTQQDLRLDGRPTCSRCRTQAGLGRWSCHCIPEKDRGSGECHWGRAALESSWICMRLRGFWLQSNTTSSFCTKKGFISLNLRSYAESQKKEFTPIKIGIYQPESSTLFPAKPSHL